MKTRLLFAALCAAVNMAANCATMPPDSVIRAELTPEELNEKPGYHQMKGAILSDVRTWRRLDIVVAEEGRKEAPKSIVYPAGIATCDYDKNEFEIFQLKSDLADQPYRVEETAFYCRKENLYYYHYQGGPKRLDLWLGPYRIERKRPKTDDQ
jgi:hypothetical protein